MAHFIPPLDKFFVFFPAYILKVQRAAFRQVLHGLQVIDSLCPHDRTPTDWFRFYNIAGLRSGKIADGPAVNGPASAPVLLSHEVAIFINTVTDYMNVEILRVGSNK